MHDLGTGEEKYQITSGEWRVREIIDVDENEKKTLFETSDISINPMFSGAGTNLKTLEYLSMGIPMVSTDVGVRGIKLKDGEHFILANKESFAEKLNTLVNDGTTKQKISKQSKLYINEFFNWKKIADDFVKILAGVSESHGGEVEIRNNSNQYVKFNTLSGKISLPKFFPVCFFFFFFFFCQFLL